MKKHVAYLWLVDSIEIVIQKQMTRITLNPAVRFMSLDVRDVSLTIIYNDMVVDMIFDDKMGLWNITFNNSHGYVRFWTIIPELQIYSEIADILLEYPGELIYLKDSEFFEKLIPILPYYKIRMENKAYRLSSVMLSKVLDEGLLPTRAMDLIINKINIGDTAVISKDFNSVGVEEDAVLTYLLVRELIPIQMLRKIFLDDSLDFDVYFINRITIKPILLEKVLGRSTFELTRMAYLENDSNDKSINEILERDFPFIRRYLKKFKKEVGIR